MHTDYEAVLLEDSTQQELIWDTDWNPESQEATFESLINIRLHQNIRSLYLQTMKRTNAMNNQQNQKEPREIRGALSCQLRNGNDVACLRSLGSLFNSELDLLTFGQVLVPITLNGKEMSFSKKDKRKPLGMNYPKEESN